MRDGVVRSGNVLIGTNGRVVIFMKQQQQQQPNDDDKASLMASQLD